MATNKKTSSYKMTLVTGVVALASILLISLVADNAINANIIYDQNPCRLIKCGTPLKGNAEAVGEDPMTGHIQCQCPNDPEPYYKVARTRSY